MHDVFLTDALNIKMALQTKKYLRETALPVPHTGKMLTAYIKSKRIYQSALTRKLGRNRGTLTAFRKRISIQTAILWEICHALNHNFFSDIAAQLPPEMPANPTPKDQRITELEKQLQELTTERNNLQKVLDILRQK
jgi:hypothetical protein